jgi:hypothetical protein
MSVRPAPLAAPEEGSANRIQAADHSKRRFVERGLAGLFTMLEDVTRPASSITKFTRTSAVCAALSLEIAFVTIEMGDQFLLPCSTHAVRLSLVPCTGVTERVDSWTISEPGGAAASRLVNDVG